MHGVIFLLLTEKTQYHYNKATVVIVVLCMLCYTYSERSNLFQAAIGHLSFTHNVLKQYIRSFIN